MTRFFFVFLLFPAFALAGTNYWVLDNCSGPEPLSIETFTLSIDGKKIQITEFEKSETSQSPIFRNLLIVIDTESDQLPESKNMATAILQRAGKLDLVSIATLSRNGLHYLTMFNADHQSSAALLNSIANEPQQKVDARPGLVAGLVELAMHMSTVSIPKHVVLFSPGFKTEGLRGAGMSDQEAPELVMGEVSEEERLLWQKDRADKKESGPDVDFSKVPELFAGSGAVLSIGVGTENTFYKSLASKTGGRLIKNVQSDFDQWPGSNSFCILGWEADFEKEFKKIHELKIESGSKIIQETSWIAARSFQSLTSEERKLKAAEAIYKKPISSESYEFLSDSIFYQGQHGIPVFAQISGKQILSTKNPEALLEFYGFAISPEGKIEDSFMVPVMLDLKNKKLKEKIDRAGLKLWNVLYPGSGTVKIHWVILNLASNQIVTHSERVESQPDSLSISNPFFPDANLDWILWPAPSTVSDRNGKQVSYPYSAGSDYFSPDLDPSLKFQDGGVLYMRMYNKDPESKNPPITFRLADESGKTTSIEEFQLLQKPLTIEKNGLELFWKIPTLPEVKSGSGHLQIEITDTRSGRIITRHTSLRIL